MSGDLEPIPVFELRAGAANLGISEEDFRERIRAAFRVPAHMLGREDVTRFNAGILALATMQPERIDTVNIEMLPEATRLEKELSDLIKDAARVKRWHDGRIQIEGVAMTINEGYRVAVEALMAVAIAHEMRGVKDELRAIGVEPDEEVG